ncbi:hypothetical protein BDM02DRAFT_2979133 [Thelephora ganbajun]|uniref:Uncharacterized protein n=1 Tax=Thelephora ganbajun TaxID=370292 RepID=A0ACB6ZAD3_THEGA|nr:hypothetical protein BDM02DRAFT_2979133 [Thelephora ganbajun]
MPLVLLTRHLSSIVAMTKASGQNFGWRHRFSQDTRDLALKSTPGLVLLTWRVWRSFHARNLLVMPGTIVRQVNHPRPHPDNNNSQRTGLGSGSEHPGCAI